MESMSVAELLELIVLSEASIDAQFEFWLTITFATIIASFAASERLSLRLRFLLATLYLLATFVCASRTFFDIQDINQYVAVLESLGVEQFVPRATGMAKLALGVLGTASALYFLFDTGRKPQPEANQAS